MSSFFHLIKDPLFNSFGDFSLWENLVLPRSGAQMVIGDAILPILPIIPRVLCVYIVSGEWSLEPLANFVDLKYGIKCIFHRCIIIATANSRPVVFYVFKASFQGQL